MTRSTASESGVEIETRKGQLPSVVLITAAHVASTGLRTVLKESPDLRLVEEVWPGPAAVSAADKWQPDHVVLAADGVSEQIITLVRQTRQVSPRSAIVACTNEVDQEALLTLARIPTEAILAWADVTPGLLYDTLSLVAHGLRLQSPAASEAMLAAQGSARPARRSVALTKREQAVLQAMGSSDTQRDIAASLNIGERTVHDVIATLKRKLNVRTTFMLGAWGHALRLIELGDPDRPLPREARTLPNTAKKSAEKD